MVQGEKHSGIHCKNYAGGINPDRGMSRRAKRNSHKRRRQALAIDLKDQVGRVTQQ